MDLLKTLIKNVNVDANNSEIYKDEFEQSIAAVFQYNSEYPLFKEVQNIIQLKIFLMCSPNKTRNLYNEDKRIDHSNIFHLIELQIMKLLKEGDHLHIFEL